MVEPSNIERGELPETSREYMESLEAKIGELMCLLRQCAVTATEITGDESADIRSVGVAMNCKLATIPDRVSDRIADLEYIV